MTHPITETTEVPHNRCKKCGHQFTSPDGKQYRDGDVEVWCPKCGANDDHFEDIADQKPEAVEDSAHGLPASCLNTGSSSSTPTASGDPCDELLAILRDVVTVNESHVLDVTEDALSRLGAFFASLAPRGVAGDPCARAAEAIEQALEDEKNELRGFVTASDIAAIIRREVAGHYEKEIERLNAVIEQQSKTLGIIKTCECDLRARLSAAEADSKRLETDHNVESGQVQVGRYRLAGWRL